MTICAAVRMKDGVHDAASAVTPTGAEEAGLLQADTETARQAFATFRLRIQACCRGDLRRFVKKYLVLLL